MAWYICLGVAFVVILLRKSRLPGSQKMQKLPLFIMIGAIAFWLLYTFKIIRGDLTVIDCILIGALLETAIQSGLIHTNSGYRELFQSTTVSVVIVDEDFQARYTSGGAIPVDEASMRATKDGTVAFEDTLLSSAPIRAGRMPSFPQNRNKARLHVQRRLLRYSISVNRRFRSGCGHFLHGGG